jgi:uncharacterized repeat protein (TIGR03803 family)
LNLDGTGFEVLHAFSCESEGGFPSASLTAGSDGKFYGATPVGGAAGGGTIFAMDTSGSVSVVLSLGCLTPCIPAGVLTAGRDGKFYGTTTNGGATGQGTVFRTNPDGTAFEVLHAFACPSDGCQPAAGLTAGSDGSSTARLRGTAPRAGARSSG